MQAELVGNPDFGHVQFRLDQGEKILIEGGSMASMDADLEVNSHLMGGLFPALMRRILAGESLWMGEYTSPRAGGRLQVASAVPGMVVQRAVQGPPLYLQAGSFLACTHGVHLSTVFGGLRALFSGEGLFFLKVTGQGDLWLNAYGAVIERDLRGQELIVESGHVMAWEEGVDWHIQGMGNLFSTFFSGEGLVMRFKGQGKVWLQSRSVGSLVDWLRGYSR